LAKCGGYRFNTTLEDSVEEGSFRVDYVVLVNDEPRLLCEVKSPSVMKMAGELLPPHGIELKWDYGQSLVPKILAEASALFPVGYNIGFKKICVGRTVYGSETDGMAVSYLPQLLDCVPSCDA
jgi:hypothetical protein